MLLSLLSPIKFKSVGNLLCFSMLYQCREPQQKMKR